MMSEVKGKSQLSRFKAVPIRQTHNSKKQVENTQVRTQFIMQAFREATKAVVKVMTEVTYAVKEVKEHLW